MNAYSLTSEQCAQIVDAAYRILEEIGCEVRNEEARQLVETAGCRIDGNRVYVPRAVVQAAIETAPKVVNIYDRDGNLAMELAPEPKKCYYCPGTSAVNRLDPLTGERRLPTKKDVFETLVMEDRLENIDLTCGCGNIADCPQRIVGVWELRYMLEGSSKPCMMNPMDSEAAKTQVELLVAVRGSLESLIEKPMTLIQGPTISPLRYDDDALKTFLYLVDCGMPISLIGTPGLNSTGPATIAGCMALGLADSFFGLVLTQARKPGAPYLLTDFVDQMDLRITMNVMSSPEFVKVSAMDADLFRYIGLPSFSHMVASDSKLFDQQAAHDFTSAIIMGQAHRVPLSYFTGYLEGGMSSSLEGIVYADEMIGYTRKLLEPIEVSEETLALDVMKDVLPEDNFLAEEHTIDHMGETWEPTVTDRRSYEAWIADGGLDYRQRAINRALALIEQGPREPLPAEVVAKLDAIMEEADRRFA